MCLFNSSDVKVLSQKRAEIMTDIIHGRPPAVPVDNPFFRWWQSIDQWTLLATLALIVSWVAPINGSLCASSRLQ